MVDVTVVFWRDIPAQVLVGRGRRAQKRPLPERFEQAIDRAAMKSGAAGTDEYLAEWRRAEAVQVDGEADSVANEWLEKLDSEYPNERLRILIEQGGREIQEV